MKLTVQFIFVIVLMLVVSSIAFSQGPPAPQNLIVQKGLLGGSVLKWDTSSGATGYVIYKSIDGSKFIRIGAVHRMGFLDWYVFPGHLYRYFVTAFNMIQESEPSNIVPFAFGHRRPPLPGEGVIAGKIVDDKSGDPLEDAIVKFYKPGKLWAEVTHTDTGGVYWAALDTGRYLIRAEKFGYLGEWFDNSLHIDSAMVINLHEDTVIANFALHRLPMPQPVSASGTVTDSETGNPLPNTFVAYLRPHRWFRELQMMTGFFGGFPFERFDMPELGRLHGVVWMGLTNDSGRYTAHVVKGLRYIAFAFKPGYVPEFYNNKFTPFDADRIHLINDTTRIDFALTTNPLATNSMYGTVLDSDNSGIPSHVVLFKRTIYGWLPTRFRMTDSLGNFEFHYLVNGVFAVKAVPVDGYAPAWYSESFCGVRNWRFTDTIRVFNGDVNNINVCVIPSPRLGFARIAGIVDRGTEKFMAITPEQGVTVYAVSTSTNEVMGYDVTEGDGSYSIESIPEGTYNIIVDKEGTAAANTPQITVNGDNNYEVTDVAVTVNDEGLSVDENANSLPVEYKLYQNYPNPFNPVTQIKFALPKASNVSLKVYNLIGQEVEALVNSTIEAGIHSVEWNARQSSTGIYFVKITASPVDGKIASYSEVRKMILVK